MKLILNNISQGGTLRVAFNLGNRALVQRDGNGDLHGVSPKLAQRLADTLGLDLAPVVYPGAGKVFDAALEDQWDVGFLAIDPLRKTRLSFTRPYHVVEATYAVRKNAPFERAEDVDKDGVSILTAEGSAYALHLQKTLRHATLDQAGTPQESFVAFAKGECDMVAGVRESLEKHFLGDSDIRILPGALARVEQAMVLPGPSNPLIEALDGFLVEAIESGVAAAALGRQAG